jgi:hypothetical protein
MNYCFLEINLKNINSNSVIHIFLEINLTKFMHGCMCTVSTNTFAYSKMTKSPLVVINELQEIYSCTCGIALNTYYLLAFANNF